jgi:uncharacterized membrane protein
LAFAQPMRQYAKKEIAFERVLFFSDAVVAIAITLLAFNLKLNVPPEHHITFTDLLSPWQQYLAFILSFLNIAILWRTHHDFFIYIHKMNDRIMALNICWLFLIITLPFATSLLSTHFGDTPAMLLYTGDIFLLSICQNYIWDYAYLQEDYIDHEKLKEFPEMDKRFRLMLNLDMLNGLIAVIVAFFMPKTAFFLLFFRVPIIIFSAFYIARQRRLGKIQ